jgi:hypothetical protein
MGLDSGIASTYKTICDLLKLQGTGVQVGNAIRTGSQNYAAGPIAMLQNLETLAKFTGKTLIDEAGSANLYS